MAGKAPKIRAVDLPQTGLIINVERTSYPTRSVDMKHVAVIAILCSFLFSHSTHAHHGKKYLVTGSHELSPPGSVHALLAIETRDDLGSRSYRLDPGILLGLADRLDAELHTHLDIADGGLHMEAIALETRLGLFGQYNEHTEGKPVDVPYGVGLLLEFEKGLGHHADSFEGRIVTGLNLRPFSIAGNLLWQTNFRKDQSDELRYVIGVRRAIVHDLGIGVEVDGGFDAIRTLRVTPGVFLSMIDRLDVKAGASIRLNPDFHENVIRIAFIYNIR